MIRNLFAPIFLAACFALPLAARADAPASQPAPAGSLLILPFDELPSNDPLAEGHWSFQVYGSGTVGKNSNAIYGGHIGVGYHFLDGVSINAEFVGEAFHMQDTPAATGGDTAGGAFEILFRWHLLRGDGWSVFTDIGAGIMEASDSFPSEGTHFNFRPQAGFGATLKLTDDLYLIGGLKWFHISNARIEGVEHNPSYDSLMYYAGVMIPF